MQYFTDKGLEQFTKLLNDFIFVFIFVRQLYKRERDAFRSLFHRAERIMINHKAHPATQI